MRIRLHTSRRRGKQRQLRQWALLTGSVCVLLFCVFGLARYFLNARRGPILKQFEVSFAMSAAESNPAAPTEKPKFSAWPGNPSMTVSESLKKLQRQNRDVIGWLTLPDSLGQAVVQRGNEYYLKRDYLGYHNANGALFLEESISLKTRPDTYIIFGHNMKTGEMFGALRLYEDAGYYRKNAIIDFDVLYYEKGSKLRKLERQLLSSNKPKLNVKSY